jgi:hypothetical protein
MQLKNVIAHDLNEMDIWSRFRFMVLNTTFQQYFSHIVAASFVGGGK